jgi:hypothetical protein
MSFNACVGSLLFSLAGTALIGIALLWVISTYGLPAIIGFFLLIIIVSLILVVKG